jgi:hypothetical protein
MGGPADHSRAGQATHPFHLAIRRVTTAPAASGAGGSGSDSGAAAPGTPNALASAGPRARARSSATLSAASWPHATSALMLLCEHPFRGDEYINNTSVWCGEHGPTSAMVTGFRFTRRSRKPQPTHGRASSLRYTLPPPSVVLLAVFLTLRDGHGVLLAHGGVFHEHSPACELVALSLLLGYRHEQLRVLRTGRHGGGAASNTRATP